MPWVYLHLKISEIMWGICFDVKRRVIGTQSRQCSRLPRGGKTLSNSIHAGSVSLYPSILSTYLPNPKITTLDTCEMQQVADLNLCSIWPTVGRGGGSKICCSLVVKVVVDRYNIHVSYVTQNVENKPLIITYYFILIFSIRVIYL